MTIKTKPSPPLKPFTWLVDYYPVLILFAMGIWLVVIRPMGPTPIPGFRLSLVPGDLGDARFNNYVLEHFYQWISGIVPSYWNAGFFYPFPGTMAFSDTLLGSAPLYAALRWIGLDTPTAYQAWYIIGAALNYAAAAYVLGRLKLKPLAVGVGAFFFAFGLPLLAQENHAQLIYHFCVPLAVFALWKFYRQPQLWRIAVLLGLVVWQFYLTIYIGVFLVFLLTAMIVLLPFFVGLHSFRQWLALWPRRLVQAWSNSHPVEKVLSLAAVFAIGAGFAILIFPYYHFVRVYHFARNMNDIKSLLPTFKSYVLADNSMIWQSVSGLIKYMPLRWEHQLFPGLAVILLGVGGLTLRIHTSNGRFARLHFWMGVALGALTFTIRGISLYWLIWRLPGINSLRAITRIMLVIMWPLALYAAWVLDGILRRSAEHRRWMRVPLYLICGLLVAESVFYNHASFAKADFLARLDSLRQELPTELPTDPILMVARNQQEPFYTTEIDAMLLSQQLGWPTLNGYSGNNPPGYMFADNCNAIPNRIINYMQFSGITDPSFYVAMMQRVVPIGFSGCDPTWWEKMP